MELMFGSSCLHGTQSKCTPDELVSLRAGVANLWHMCCHWLAVSLKALEGSPSLT